jgi:general secretion pathway protein C
MNTLAWIEEHRSAAALQRLLQVRGAQIVVAILLAAIAIDAALLITGLLSRTAALPAAPVPAPRAPVANPAVALATVVNAHLFGVTSAGNAADAPQTTMPLVLAGVLATSDPKSGQAIIGPNAGAAKLYAVGDMIQGGARLNAVYNDRVLIERNGAVEALPLPRTSSIAGMAPAPLGANPLLARAQANARDNALFSGLLRIQPVFNQGKLGGYRVFPGPRGANVLTQLGLRPGDLITAINGTQLDDASRAMEIVQTLGSSDSASVTVSRNGQLQELNLNLSNITTEADNANAGTEAAAEAQNPGLPPAYRQSRSGGAQRGLAPGLSNAPAAPGAGADGAANAQGNGTGAGAGERPPAER